MIKTMLSIFCWVLALLLSPIIFILGTICGIMGSEKLMTWSEYLKHYFADKTV